MDRPIVVTANAAAAVERARELLARDPGPLFVERCSAEDRRRRRFTTALTVELGSGVGLHHDVEVHLGPHRSAGADVVLPVRWLPAGHERLFPSFDGELTVTEDDGRTLLVLEGHYTIPLGALGRLGDGVAGTHVASRSVGRFLASVATRLETAVARRDGAHPLRPSPPAASHDAAREIGSENYVG